MSGRETHKEGLKSLQTEEKESFPHFAKQECLYGIKFQWLWSLVLLSVELCLLAGLTAGEEVAPKSQ